MTKYTPRPSNFHAETVGATAVQVCGGSPDRRALHLSAHGGNIWVSPNPSMAVGEGVVVPNDLQPTEICACHQGQFVTLPLYAIASAANSLLYIVEGFEDQWPQNNLQSY